MSRANRKGGTQIHNAGARVQDIDWDAVVADLDEQGWGTFPGLLTAAECLPFEQNADPFATVIRCTCDGSLDNKTISKWARALRYVAYCLVPRTQLKAFMKEMGGVNACADRYARYYGRGRR
jgi:hypothetical protein